MSLIEEFRAKVISDIMSMPNMAYSWAHFRSCLGSHVSHPAPTPAELFSLGDQLSAAFRSNRLPTKAGSTTTQAKEQSEASAGGSVWEGLIVWYLNLCLAGSRSVAIKKNSHLPNTVRESLKVIISGGISLTEPDVLVLTFDDPRVDDPIPLAKNGAPIRTSPIKLLQTLIDSSVLADASYRKKVTVINIQCKTNWNDSIQTPMLWNLLYASARHLSGSSSSAVLPILKANSITFGDGGNYIKDLGGYAYGFVTVPTNEKGASAYTSTSTPVIRARSFTAGHYWGKASKPHICTSVKEFFNSNATLLSSGLIPGEGFANSFPNVNKGVFQFP